MSPTHADISRSVRTPSKNQSYKKDIRQSINYVIDETSEKHELAHFGIERVKDTNTEAIEYLNESNTNQLYTPKK